jgi:ABC-type glycerol-3-phosphate transport system substrate-binding protein
MRIRPRLWLPFVLALLLLASALLLAACDLSPAQPTTAPTVPTGATAAPKQPTAAPTEPGPVEPAVITLTIWTTEAFSPTEATVEGQILDQQAAAFEASHSDVRIEFVLKKPYGKGGILDYLLTTSAVVPDLLPDVALIDVDELGAAVQAELVYPLGDLMPPDLTGDLYAFAREAGTFEGQLYGLQYWADLDHLAYNTGEMTVPPSSWPGVLSNPGPYLFPAGGQAGLVNDDFLVQYLALQDTISAEGPDDQPLDLDSLTAVLQFYQDGASQGIFPPEILDYQTTDDSWEAYRDGEGTLSHVNSHRYLIDRALLPSTAAAPIPTINGPGSSIGQGWALAVTTPDPARQALAAEFVTQMMAPETNSAWNLATNHLPTRQQALANWDQSDGYTRLLQDLLTAAQPRPHLDNYTQVTAALQQAVEAVLTGVLTPEEAAAEAIAGVE